MKKIACAVVATALILLPALVAPALAQVPAASRITGPAYYELREYTLVPGRMEALKTRFRDHAVALLQKHGMTEVGWWVKQGGPDEVLVYLLAYPSQAAREASWAAFNADPEWLRVKAASEADGKIVARVDSTFMTMTDFSPHPTTADGTVLK